MTNATKTNLFFSITMAVTAVCCDNPAIGQNFAAVGHVNPFARQGHQSLSDHHRSHRHQDHYRNLNHGYRHHDFGHRVVYGYRGFNGHAVADILRSKAQANLVNAQARTQNEIARSAALDNSVKALQTYIDRRTINSQVRFGHLHAQADQRRAARAEATMVAMRHRIEEESRNRLSPDGLPMSVAG